MKALTLTQPWATLVAVGAKTLETRSWGTSGALSVGDSLPRGAIIAITSVTACHRSNSPTVEQLLHARPRRERRFGDFSSGRWVWVLDDVRQVDSPLLCRGTLGLWEVPESIDALLEPLGVSVER